MKSIILVLFSIFSFAAAAQNIDSLVQKRVALGETPGIVVGVYSNNTVRYYVAGVESLETKKKVTSKTLFEIGSISKTFTTTLLAIMVNNKTMALTDPAQQFMPEGVRIPDRDGKIITLENLATAHSSLPRMPLNFQPASPENPYVDYTAKQLTEFFTNYSLSRDPGSLYEYSNLGMGVLGLAITTQSHKTFNQLMQEFITKPLNMNSTVLNYADKKFPNVAQGYNGKIPAHAWYWTDESIMAPAGGILSNAEDMMLYVIANLKEEPTSLGKAMALTHQPRMEAGSPDMQIGLGWHIRDNKVIWHNGGTGGFRSFTGFNPATKSAVVILTNSTTGADDLGQYLLDKTFPLKKISVAVTVDPAILNSYTGIYALTPEFKISITIKDGSLYCQATGQSAFELFAESDKKFFLKVVNAQFEFVKGADGKIDKLLLYQNGAVQPAVRVK